MAIKGRASSKSCSRPDNEKIKSGWASRRFTKTVFLVAGIYGLMILAPIYFIKNKFGQETPPAITHPEYFYGFLGVALSWQVLFLILIERSGAVLRDDPPVHSGKNQLWDCVDCSLVARPHPRFHPCDRFGGLGFGFLISSSVLHDKTRSCCRLIRFSLISPTIYTV